MILCFWESSVPTGASPQGQTREGVGDQHRGTAQCRQHHRDDVERRGLLFEAHGSHGGSPRSRESARERRASTGHRPQFRRTDGPASTQGDGDVERDGLGPRIQIDGGPYATLGEDERRVRDEVYYARDDVVEIVHNEYVDKMPAYDVECYHRTQIDTCDAEIYEALRIQRRSTMSWARTVSIRTRTSI